MWRNFTPGSTIDPYKQWVLSIDVIIIRVNNSPPHSLCTPYHEPIVCVIYHVFSQIIVEIRFYIHLPSDALLFQPYINHMHCKNILVKPLWPIFSTQLFFDIKTFLEAPIVPINLATCAVVYIFCDWLWCGRINHIGICIWGSFLLPPSHAIVLLPFLHQASSKNEVPPVLIHPKKSPNIGFVLSTGLVNNPFISPQFCNSVLDRYTIGNFRVAVLIMTMKQGTCFHNSSAAGTDAKY